jgi:D-amino-acid dehydrogenase
MLCKQPATLDKERRLSEQASALGMEANVLDARAVAELEPDIRMDVAGGVHFPRDAHLDPARLMASLEQRLAAADAELRWETAAGDWRIESGWIEAVLTDRGPIEGDRFVLCGGAWSPELARQIRLHLPMQAGKGYSLTLPNPRQRPSMCAVLTEARVAVTPIGQSLRFGGTMEIAGLDESIEPRRVEGIVASAWAYFPNFTSHDFDGVKPWCGLRPCTPDGLPYIGHTRRIGNLLVAAGHAMLGVSLAPITGRIVAELIANERPAFDMELLSPDRYWAK